MLDITWLQDANLANTVSFDASGIASNGAMSWDTANTWIAEMNAKSYLGYDNWRLPTLSPVDAGSSLNTDFSTNASTDRGYAKTTMNGSDGGWRDKANGNPVSEMAVA